MPRLGSAVTALSSFWPIVRTKTCRTFAVSGARKESRLPSGEIRARYFSGFPKSVSRGMSAESSARAGGAAASASGSAIKKIRVQRRAPPPTIDDLRQGYGRTVYLPEGTQIGAVVLPSCVRRLRRFLRSGARTLLRPRSGAGVRDARAGRAGRDEEGYAPAREAVAVRSPGCGRLRPGGVLAPGVHAASNYFT